MLLYLSLPKTNNPTRITDLRPLTILTELSKLLEKIVKIELQTNLEKYNILPSTQSGFRDGCSCGTALLHLVDDKKKRDNKKLGILVLRDYNKAFYMINHQTFLVILHYVGLSNTATQL